MGVLGSLWVCQGASGCVGEPLGVWLCKPVSLPLALEAACRIHGSVQGAVWRVQGPRQRSWCCFVRAGYITTIVADGPGCLSMRCPDPDCEAAVPETFVKTLAPEATWNKYKRYVLRSYVDDNRNVSRGHAAGLLMGPRGANSLHAMHCWGQGSCSAGWVLPEAVARADPPWVTLLCSSARRFVVCVVLQAKWCPAPGCEYAVEFFPDLSNYDIACKCGHNFCWNVSPWGPRSGEKQVHWPLQRVHRPLSSVGAVLPV